MVRLNWLGSWLWFSSKGERYIALFYQLTAMVFLQTETYDYAGLLNSGLTLMFTFIGLLIMVRCWIYIQQELKTSPVYTRAQKFRNTVSAMTFSFMVAMAAIFVLAMISSIFARNA
ncbi:MAG: hypothetical protein ACTSYI_14325, partial [Promethearchaeota archaeon]